MNFVSLYIELDQTQSTKEKRQILVDFLKTGDDLEVAWSIALILGRSPPRRFKRRELVDLALLKTQLPEWLFREAHSAVGDFGETVAHLVAKKGAPTYLASIGKWIETELARALNPSQMLLAEWDRWDATSLFIFHKLLSGGLRVGVAKGILIQAVAVAYDLKEATAAQLLMGDWKPTADWARALREGKLGSEDSWSAPYPFYLASPFDGPVEALGHPSDFLIEWKWDGIRAQWVYREGKVAVWSRGEDLITDRFPELVVTADPLFSPLAEYSTLVLDGEVLAFKEDSPLPFQALQTRIGRTKLTKSVLDAAPVRFVAYDCLELNGEDLRPRPQIERRAILEKVVQKLSLANPNFVVSSVLEFPTWDDAEKLRLSSRDRKVEGFMLKRKTAPYLHGRKRGDWWKWKIAPLSLDAVLIYAQSGSGKRANLFTDYTFAVLDAKGELVPITKAYSGLDAEEIAELDRWIRKNTKDRFGPVRSVKPEQVFELVFEGAALSDRHKAGVALRFPRILRWRKDKKWNEVDHLEEFRDRFVDK